MFFFSLYPPNLHHPPPPPHVQYYIHNDGNTLLTHRDAYTPTASRRLHRFASAHRLYQAMTTAAAAAVVPSSFCAAATICHGRVAAGAAAAAVLGVVKMRAHRATTGTQPIGRALALDASARSAWLQSVSVLECVFVWVVFRGLVYYVNVARVELRSIGIMLLPILRYITRQSRYSILTPIVLSLARYAKPY